MCLLKSGLLGRGLQSGRQVVVDKNTKVEDQHSEQLTDREWLN